MLVTETEQSSNTEKNSKFLFTQNNNVDKVNRNQPNCATVNSLTFLLAFSYRASAVSNKL